MKKRSAFTLVELLVVIAIIGILVAVFLPAINAARSSARSVNCKNKVRQLSLAAINYESAFGFFPPARFQPRPGDLKRRQCGGSGVSWVVHILPYLEQTSFSKEWNLYNDFAQHELAIRTRAIDDLACPERRSADSMAHDPERIYGASQTSAKSRQSARSGFPHKIVSPLAAG